MTSLANTASANILAAKDNNVPMASSVTHNADGQQQKEKDLEYHRQVLKSKMEAQEYVEARRRPNAREFSGSDVGELPCANRSGNNYVSPSDEIMSPCTAKLNALRNKQVGKYVSPLHPPTPTPSEQEEVLIQTFFPQGQAQVPLRPSFV